MKGFIKWIIGVSTTILLGLITWGFTYVYDDIKHETNQDNEIKITAEKAINIESMAKSNDEAIDEIKEKMATKEDVEKLETKIEKRFDKLENLLIYQHMENKKLIADEN